MKLQLAHLRETVNRNFAEGWPTGLVFLDVVEDFDTKWDKGLLHKATVLNLPTDVMNIISSYFHLQTF
jgi:hypothetical protein